MGIASPREVHRTYLLRPSVHAPCCTSIGRPFLSTAAVLKEDLSGRPMDVQRLHKVEHQNSHM